MINAKAVVTLGKDMTFRDYAQGAFRMRQIGVGQKLELFIIPEVKSLYEREVSRGSGIALAKIKVRVWGGGQFGVSATCVHVCMRAGVTTGRSVQGYNPITLTKLVVCVLVAARVSGQTPSPFRTAACCSLSLPGW